MTTKKEMLEKQLKNRGISDSKVLQAMEEVDRKNFVPEEMEPHAYEDRPLPIGKEQTISQPYIVAYMAQELQVGKDDRILEIGTGCGYNAAVLSKMAGKVYSIEIIEWLAQYAKENLTKTKAVNVETRHGDGYNGWSEKSPFDAIVLTAAPASIPAPLKNQLKVGGKIIAPVGRAGQKLVRLEKISENDFKEETLLMVSFVPMTGEAQK